MQRLLFSALFFAAACGGSTTPTPGGGTKAGTPDASMSTTAPADGGTSGTPDGSFPPGAAITATAGTWTWVNIPGAVCDDNSPTGVGVNLSASGSKNTIFFFEGGGACWNYLTCVSLNVSTHGPYGATQFSATTANEFTNSAFDRTLANNPFADWNYIYVPYCTSDVHGGQNVATYTSGTASQTFQHVGHTNVLWDLTRLVPTFSSSSKIVVSGSSAGGFGALLNFPTIHASFPNAETYLLDDSGPLMSNIPADTVAAWYAEWKIGELVTPLCGANCQSDLSQAMQSLSAAYPNSRMALLSSEQDATISSYFQLNATQFMTGLLALAAMHLDVTTNFKYFFVAGTTHTMLYSPTDMPFASVTPPLLTWLTQFVNDDSAWTSLKP